MTDQGVGSETETAAAGDAAELTHDALPEELDVTKYVGPYTFPNVRRRSIAGTIYLIVGALCIVGGLVAPNDGVLAVGIVLVAIGAYHWWAAWNVAVDETDALVIAIREVGFPIGHASAAMVWRGWRSRPVWRILLYSADEPPTKRGLVQVDAVSGDVLGQYVEENPEDWATLKSS